MRIDRRQAVDSRKVAELSGSCRVSVKDFQNACWEAGKQLLEEIREDVGGSTSDRDILTPGGCADTVAAYARGIDVLAGWQADPSVAMAALEETALVRGGWEPGLVTGLVRTAAVSIALAERGLSEKSYAARQHNALEAMSEAWDVEVSINPSGKRHETELYAEAQADLLRDEAAYGRELFSRSPFHYYPEFVSETWKEYRREHKEETAGVELSQDDLETLCVRAAENFKTVDHSDVFEEELKLDIEAFVDERKQAMDEADRLAEQQVERGREELGEAVEK